VDDEIRRQVASARKHQEVFHEALAAARSRVRDARRGVRCAGTSCSNSIGWTCCDEI
jgi:hypothetical protein